MQSRFKLTLLLAVITALFFSSCSSKTNKEGRYVPLNAVFVLHINGQSINSKLPWEEIKQNELFKEAYADSSTSALMRSVLDNPENTGIDVKNDILQFVVNDSTGGYMAVEGSLKDAAKFKQFTAEASKNLAVETEKNGIHFLSTDKMTAAWNKEKFVYVVNAHMFGRRSRNYSAEKDLNAIATQIFDLKEKGSLGADEKFSGLVGTTGDIHFWFNIEAMNISAEDLPRNMGPLAMIDLKKMYEGTRLTGTVNFENGKISADFKSYASKEMTEILKKYSGDKLSSDMLKRIPSNNLAGFFALNFKPEGIREYLKMLGLEGFANMGERMLGFNLDDFIKANKGDILVAVTDISKDSSGKPDASVIFSASIGDKQSFNKLVEAGKKLFDQNMGDFGPTFFYNMNENYFAIGNKKPEVDKYISTANNSNPAILDKISGSAGAAYINIQYLMKSVGPGKDSLDIATYNASIKIWDDVVAYGTGFKDGGSTQHLEINLLDKNTNSLKQMNAYMGEMGVIQKKRKEQYRSYYDMDKDKIDSTMKMIDSLKQQLH